MITVEFDDKAFYRDMNNILGYSEGFLEGAERAKPEFLREIGKNTIDILKEFIDQQARIDPQMYHHIYEWYMEGNSAGRLFDIEYTSRDGGLTFFGTLRQSRSIKNGSTTPFYNKASIMERGVSVTIKPKTSKALKFNVGTEDVFVSGPVVVENPGGTRVVGSFERIFNEFFANHFRQSVLDITGIRRHLEKAKPYSDNFRAAKNGGKAKGLEVGYNWIANAGGLNV
jgi:hypothetical protein